MSENKDNIEYASTPERAGNNFWSELGSWKSEKLEKSYVQVPYDTLQRQTAD